jgi:hypothetical protein
MKKIYESCKNLIAKIFNKRRTEYMYMFVLDSMISVSAKDYLSKRMKTDSDYAGFGKDEERFREQLRIDVIRFVERDIVQHGKKIADNSVVFDTKEYKTYYIFASSSIRSDVYLTPVMLEIYAFKQIKKDNIFSYPFEQLLFKGMETEVKIYKFKIEC